MSRHSFMVMGIFFIASLLEAKESEPLVPADKKNLHPHSPLFSISAIRPRDTAASAIPLPTKDTPTAANAVNPSFPQRDSMRAKPVAGSAHPGTSAMADTPKIQSGSKAADSVHAERSPLMRSAKDNKGIEPKSVHPPLRPGPKETAPLTKENRRHKGIGAIFDLRYSILLLSIIIIGLYLRSALKKTNQPTFVTTTRLSIMDKEVQTACRYIEKNYKNPGLSVEKVCEDLVTGKAFLDALFHQELGLGVAEFITHVRINRARMLLEKKASVDADEVARETGFLDTNSFCDAFNTIVDMPFEKYRERHEKNNA